ncbi:hypothetical protein [Kitasatospora sp. NPDC057500]|uniref:hypothetical protein n=1 Tax=Kitasatospora sp. NPDC057500 TaxID=3346151 RepID=UPI00368DF430
MNKQQPLRSAGLRSEAAARSGGARRTRRGQLPEIAPGTFDAAELLASVTTSLRPVIDAQLEQIAAALTASVSSAEGSDVAAAIRAELTRRLVPQFTEAVRSAVVEGMRTRQMHLAQLAVIDRVAYQAPTLTSLQKRIDHEITKVGLIRVIDPGDLSLFSLANPGQRRPENSETPAFSVVSPAYTDRESGRLVEAGWLRIEDDHTPEDLPKSLTPRQKRQQRSKGELPPNRQAAPAKTQAAPKKPHRKGPSRRAGAVPPDVESASGAAPAPNRHREGRVPNTPPLPGDHHASRRGVTGNQRTGRHQKGTR